MNRTRLYSNYDHDSFCLSDWTPSNPPLAARGTHWSFLEKARFESALHRYGPFAWRSIIRAVGTRSEKQVKAYAARYRRRKKLAAQAALGAYRQSTSGPFTPTSSYSGDPYYSDGLGTPSLRSPIPPLSSDPLPTSFSIGARSTTTDKQLVNLSLETPPMLPSFCPPHYDFQPAIKTLHTKPSAPLLSQPLAIQETVHGCRSTTSTVSSVSLRRRYDLASSARKPRRCASTQTSTEQPNSLSSSIYNNSKSFQISIPSSLMSTPGNSADNMFICDDMMPSSVKSNSGQITTADLSQPTLLPPKLLQPDENETIPSSSFTPHHQYQIQDILPFDHYSSFNAVANHSNDSHQLPDDHTAVTSPHGQEVTYDFTHVSSGVLDDEEMICSFNSDIFSSLDNCDSLSCTDDAYFQLL